MVIISPLRSVGLTCIALVAFQLASAQTLVDKDATMETKALFENLSRISKQGFLFGHQDTDAYGVGWKGDENRSDVKDVTGDFPAVHGWDLGKIGKSENIDGVPFEKMLNWIKATYKRGGVNTISAHLDNPLTGESTWSKGEAAKESLPGGKAHMRYVQDLDHIASFLDRCEIDGKKIPIIFRPLHEHNGNWFWWGKGNADEQDYIKLWRFTVDYLKNEKKLHHLIYAFSPDRSRLKLKTFSQSYQYAYPGDDYVDILGYDNYFDVGSNQNKVSEEKRIADLTFGLKELTKLAAEKKKVAALTETGLEGVRDPKWFSKFLLGPYDKDPKIEMAFLLVWRNGNNKHHYAPHKGHASERDFKEFYSDPRSLFEKDIQNMYSSNAPLLKK